MITHQSRIPPYFLESGRAQVITVTSGSISSISSLLIISIILRSPSRLSSSYHKIMFSLSFFDTLSSVAMALSTLPMSKDVLDVYKFVGVVLGNAGSCTAQGFAVTAGQAFAMCTNVTLSIYYVSTIRYKMTDRTVREKLLPLSATLSCLMGLPVSIIPLIMGLYNPRPFEPYCYLGSYPYECNRESTSTTTNSISASTTSSSSSSDGVSSCIRGDVPAQTEDLYFLVVIICVGTAFFLMVVSLVIVVMSVFQTEMSVRKHLHHAKDDTLEDDDEDDDDDHDDEDDDEDEDQDENDDQDVSIPMIANVNANANVKAKPYSSNVDGAENNTGKDVNANVIVNSTSRGNSDNHAGNGTRILHTTRTHIATGNNSCSSNNCQRRGIDDFQETRTILRIALMYIGAFFLTYIWNVITMTIDIDSVTVRNFIDYGKLMCNPSQGTFNALIFIYNRIDIARQVNSNLTFHQALKMIVCTPFVVPEVMVSSLDVVDNDMNERERERERDMEEQRGHHGRRMGDHGHGRRDNHQIECECECESDLSSRSLSDGGDGHDDSSVHDDDMDTNTIDEENNNRVESGGEMSTTSSHYPLDHTTPSPPRHHDGRRHHRHRPNLSEIRVTDQKCPSVASSLSQKSTTRGLGLLLVQNGGGAADDDSVTTPDGQSRWSMNVQRKGVGYSPKKKKIKKKTQTTQTTTSPNNDRSGQSKSGQESRPSFLSDECVNSINSRNSSNSSSIPSGVMLKNGNGNGNGATGDGTTNSSCGIISSMVKSLDESGSIKCVREDDEERSLSVCDLSGFELSTVENERD